ncbi:MAG TPA: SRPBCC family protein [Verrucomicrobiae bacterium]|nr:SRPBCC family protein [Verrucomicrobiae bacterium]
MAKAARALRQVFSVEDIQLSTLIKAPCPRVFDLARSIDAHMASAAPTGERAIAGVTTGLIELNDEVTWEATHFGLRLRLTVRVTEFEKPRFFRDVLVSGNFKRMVHDHYFDEDRGMTVMRDCFRFTSPFGVLGIIGDKVFLKFYMRRFLVHRNKLLKEMAEGSDWMQYVSPTL